MRPSTRHLTDVRHAVRRGGARLTFAPVVMVALASLVLAGCYQPLLTSSEDRTQFDDYDRRRYRLPPATVMDEFGHEQPNLRGRLSPDR
ncbi:MAG: hypothetical protein KAS72_05720 [Phycisphaerales bacterium]|nr:hypothetical protein [Phycisphaerales bacterium]